MSGSAAPSKGSLYGLPARTTTPRADRNRLETLGAGLRRRRRLLLDEELGDPVDDRRDDDEVDHPADEVAVLDRIRAREPDLRVAPLAAGQDHTDDGHQQIVDDAGD